MLSLPVCTFAQDEEEEYGEEDAPKMVASGLRKPVGDKVAVTTFKGKAVDMATGKPLPGVQIQMLGDARYSAMSGEDGGFAIKVPEYARALYAHTPGFISQQVALPADTTMAMTVRMLCDKFRPMYSENTEYTAKGGGSVSHTTGMTIDNDLSVIAGGDMRTVLHSGTPGAGAAMFIRGLSSLNADAQPLIVVDGVEQDMQRSRTALHTGQFLNILANISPDDIEKVEILKNATALYGARGAAGVVLVTTKRGHSMATRIDAGLSVGVTAVPVLPTMMNASQYRTYAVDMISTMPGGGNAGNLRFLNDDPNGYYYHTYHNDTDWTDYTYRNALTQQYSLNVQGGDNIGMYNLSVGYSDAESTAVGNGMSRMNVRFNSDIDILWNLKTKFDISISRVSYDVFDDGIAEDRTSATVTSPTFLSLIKSPLLYPYQYNAIIGGYSSLLSDADDLFSQLGKGYSLANPLALTEYGMDDNKNRLENTLFNVKVEPTLRLSRYFNLTESFCYQLGRMSQRYFRPYTGVPEFDIPELGTVTSKVGSLFSNESNVVSNTTVSYERSFGPHSLKAYAGFRYSYTSYEDNNLATEYTGETNDKSPALSASNGYQTATGVEDVWKAMRTYVSADYDYAKRYFLTFSLVGESNSRFGENASGLGLFGLKWALFPSVQAGWVLTNERWFPKTSRVNYLRVNAGYDISGNDDIANYAARTSLSSVIFNYNAIGLKLSNIGNDGIQWETTRKLNLGVQACLFDNRLSLGFDYYVHNTDNLLTLKQFDSSISGIGHYWSNGGKLRNTGCELNVAVKPVVTRDWNVEAGLSLGHYNNKITALPDGDYTSSIYGADNVLTAVGRPVGLFYGYETLGVFSTEQDAATAAADGYLKMKDNTGRMVNFRAGDVHFVDKDGDGIISSVDKAVIGDPNPDIYGNVFVNAGWKRFALNVLFTYSVGNDIYNYQRSVLNAGSNFYNQQVRTADCWRYEGQVTDQPRLAYGDPMGNNRMSDRWIEDGSYLRMKSLRISYNVPVPVSWAWLQGLSVWGEANNLFTITRYTGSDPEMSVSGSVLYQGIDAGNVPHSRSFTMGVKVSL